jgi:two-component system sensor histidine kinase BarA
LSLRPSRSIRAKLALLIAASVGSAVALSFGIGSYRELNRFGEAKRAEVAATAEVLAATVADAVATANRSAANRVINSIGQIPGVRFAQIRDAAGAIFVEAGTGVALISPGRRQAEIPSLWTMLRDGSFFVTTRIVKGGVQVGSLGILVDTSELSDRLKQALVAAAWSAVAAMLIGLLIASRLQRAITRPLGSLARTMADVRLTSNFAQRAERSSDDETGQLVDAFNDMLGEIRTRDAALEDHMAGLERTVEDRTKDLAEARDVAEFANRAKSDFLATMSHEIRTPMNGMLVMAELLAGTELPARQQRYAETIVRSGQTLLTIINDILDLSKIEAGKMELEQGRVSVATLVEDVLGLFSERASSKQLDLAAQIGPDVPLVIEGDPVRLSQILSNLVNNALKFTEAGHVKLVVERRAGSAEDVELAFKVEDTGIGIPADKVDHIFEAFSQADQSTTRRFGGTGLGLSICQKLVTAMEGRIWAESTVGEGSTFAFTLKARVLEQGPTPVRTMGRSAVMALAGEATRAVIGDMLGHWGYAALPASPDTLASTGAELIFAGMDWIEARAPEISRAASRPTIICVAGFGNSKVDGLVSAGLADGVLVQPVSSARVRDILQAIEAGSLASLLESRRGDPGVALPELRRLSVLVADDSPVNREVVSEALTRLQARTSTVDDGLQAVAAFKAGQYDVVLMDCSMPEMDGFAATRAIRAYEAENGLERTPVVALTAHAAGGGGDSWRDAGMDDYLTKPFTMRSLAECLARWQPEGGALESGDTDSALPDVLRPRARTPRPRLWTSPC